MADVNGINEAFQAGFNLKINQNSRGITFELKSIFSEMEKRGLIKDKDGKGLTKQDALNMYAKLNEIHKSTGKDTNYNRMRVGQEFNYSAEQMLALAEASGYEIVKAQEAEKAQPTQQVQPENDAPHEKPIELGAEAVLKNAVADGSLEKTLGETIANKQYCGKISELLNPANGKVVYTADDNDTGCARWDAESGTIIVNTSSKEFVNGQQRKTWASMPESEKLKVLVHEAMHGAQSTSFDTQQEEMLCEMTAIRTAANFAKEKGLPTDVQMYGVNKEVLAALSPDIRAEIVKTAFEALPPEVRAGLSVDNLDSMPAGARVGVTLEQLGRMSETDLKTILENTFLQQGYSNRIKDSTGAITLHGDNGKQLDIPAGSQIVIDGKEFKIGEVFLEGRGANSGTVCNLFKVGDDGKPQNIGLVTFEDVPPTKSDSADPNNLKYISKSAQYQQAQININGQTRTINVFEYKKADEPATPAQPENEATPVTTVSTTVPADAPKPTNNQPETGRNRFAIGKIDNPFEPATMAMLYQNKNVRTNFMKTANTALGTVEYKKQYELTPEERLKTQAGIIGRYGDASHQWCAHAVSTIAERSGVNIGSHKAQVSQFINWGRANGIYKSISDAPINKNNFETVRADRAAQIQEQLPNMSEGDLIIWKSQYAAKTDVGVKLWAASHIGMIESVDTENGTVTVLEGNANIPKSDDKYERYVVQNSRQGLIGDQVVGEPVELNRTDGFIRKVYTIEDLAKFGYSGFIDMQSRIS